MSYGNGVIIGISISARPGTRKYPVNDIEVTEFGLKGDAHAKNWNRQVSLLAEESAKKYFPNKIIEPGYFSENLLTKNIELHTLPLGTKLKINEVKLEITKIGKELNEFTLKEREWRKPMLIEGVFAKVIFPGKIKIGDIIEIDKSDPRV